MYMTGDDIRGSIFDSSCDVQTYIRYLRALDDDEMIFFFQIKAMDFNLCHLYYWRFLFNFFT